MLRILEFEISVPVVSNSDCGDPEYTAPGQKKKLNDGESCSSSFLIKKARNA